MYKGNTSRLFLQLHLKCLVLFLILLSNSLTSMAQVDNDLPRLRGMVWYGSASWYGPRFHGKKTSSGEEYNKNDLTAAHRTLPFNTKVLVTNLKNNKQIVVRINDRGPFIDSRIIDLSEKAAHMIDSKTDGIALIKLQVLTSDI